MWWVWGNLRGVNNKHWRKQNFLYVIPDGLASHNDTELSGQFNKTSSRITLARKKIGNINWLTSHQRVNILSESFMSKNLQDNDILSYNRHMGTLCSVYSCILSYLFNVSPPHFYITPSSTQALLGSPPLCPWKRPRRNMKSSSSRTGRGTS